MKHLSYLLAALAIGLAAPAMRAQQDTPAAPPQPNRRLNLEPVRLEAPPREAVQDLERRIAALERKLARAEAMLSDKFALDGQQRELQRERATKVLAQLQQKQAAGQELTEAERGQLQALKAKLAAQRQPASAEGKLARLERKLADKSAPDAQPREFQRERAMKVLAQLQQKQAAGEELTEAERDQLRALKAKLGQQRQPGSLEPKLARAEPKPAAKSLQGAQERGRQLEKQLLEARRQLQAVANEPKLNEGALRERAEQIGKLEAELALLRAKVMRESKSRLSETQ